MRVLFLSQRVPYPPNRGDKIATWRLVDRIRRNHELHAIAFAHDTADESAADELRAMGISISTYPYNDRLAKLKALPLLATSRPLTLGAYGSRALQAEVDEWAAKVDAAWAYSSSMGAFLLPHAHIGRVMHFAELDSDKWRQYSERTRWPMSYVYRREWRTLFEVEQRIARSFDQNVFCTPLEQRIFVEQIPGAPSVVVRNGVDLEFFRPAPGAHEPGHLVFTGVMNYLPNVDGCVWFAEEIFPRVRERVPEARFTIVGAHPAPEIEALGQREGIRVTGFVDDTRDWLRLADVAIAPLRIARGIQNKVLEAMSMGLPVVGTTSATQGVEGEPGRDFLVADDADSQVDAICGLLRDSDAARALGARARQFVEATYDWEVVLSHLDPILNEATQDKTRA